MSAEIRQIGPGDELILAQAYASFTEDEVAKVKQYVAESGELWAGLWNGELVVLWGLIPASLLSTNGYLWCMTYPALAKCKIPFLRHSKAAVREAMKRYDTITGLCTGNLSWIRWLGAEIGPPYCGMPTFKIGP